jgi:hypothetical protein
MADVVSSVSAGGLSVVPRSGLSLRCDAMAEGTHATPVAQHKKRTRKGVRNHSRPRAFPLCSQSVEKMVPDTFVYPHGIVRGPTQLTGWRV